MKFGRLGILNTVSTYDIFNLTMSLLEYNPTLSGGAYAQ